jgi:hypothetical protein
MRHKKFEMPDGCNLNTANTVVYSDYSKVLSKMSRKFVPSFLKEQGVTTTLEPQTRSFTSNRFAALSDEKPLVNTSRPAKEAPKLAPATLASITTNGQGAKGTYAAKMAERAKIASNPNYVPPPKPVDVTSECEFPSLGGGKKNSPKPDEGVKKSNSYASLARDWAKQKEDEEEADRLLRLKIEEEEKEKALFKSMTILSMRRKMRNQYNQDEEEDDHYDESSLAGDSDEGDMHDESETSEEDQDDEDEFNQNVGWDGRRRDDLY